MAIGDIIVGIDIGASKVSLVVGEVNNFNQIEVICNTSKRSNGIHKDKIVDEALLADAIIGTIKDAERELDMKINSSYVTVPGKYVTIIPTSVTKEAKDKYSGITSRDISAALMQAKDVEIPENKQIIDIVTNSFTLDSGKVVNDPTGAYSTSFILNAELILADKDYIKQITNVFRRVDIDIDGMIPETLAEHNALLEEMDQKDNIMLVDVGAESTDIGVFINGEFVYTNSIPVGGRNITNDIEIVFNISHEEAEKLKRQYGLALKSYIENDAEVVLNTVKDGDRIIRSSNIVEVIEARVEEMFEVINKDITNQGIKQSINTVILTGQGITSISKSDILGKITLKIPVKPATSKTISLIKPTYQTAYALVKYVSAKPFAKTVASSIDQSSDSSVVTKILDKVKEFFYS